MIYPAEQDNDVLMNGSRLYYMTLSEIQKHIYSAQNKVSDYYNDDGGILIISRLDVIRKRLEEEYNIEPVFYSDKWEPYYPIYFFGGGWSLYSHDLVR